MPQVLVGNDDDVGWVSDSCGSPPDVGEDYLGDENISGVQIEHLAEPAKSAQKQKSPS